MTSDGPKLLILGAVWPEPESSAAGRRMMQLIELFRCEGWTITFAGTAARSSHAADLESMKVKTAEVKVNSATFDRFISNLSPDMVLFDRFPVEEQFGWRVEEQCPRAVRILDTEDLHCLRRARRAAIEAGQPMSRERLLQEETAKREIASILRCDISLIISEYEMELLREVFRVDDTLLQYLPFTVDALDETMVNTWARYEEREHFILIGNFRHPPNWDAVQHMHQRIWPLIRRRLPAAELHVYGAYPTQQARALHDPEQGFHVMGRTPDARAAVERARVSLAPLRYGAGLKGKLIEAMLCGTPSVTTRIGAEGIAGEHAWSGAIAESRATFAKAAVRLYTHKPEWQKARRQGRKIINSRFAGGEAEAALLERLSEIRTGLREHRMQNFTGAMLMHHRAASTRYMSKWIEAKNRSSRK